MNHQQGMDSQARTGGRKPRSGFWRGHWLALGAWMLALLNPTLLPAGNPAPALEYKVKAGYLYTFAKFVEWPAEAFAASNSPIIIGVMDAAGAMPIIQQVLASKTVNDRPIIVKRVATPEAAQGCHILFVSRTAATSPGELRGALANAATLLVGEAEQFAESGGTIGFVREEESFRLNLNLESVTNTHLKISAKLANVARLVKTQRNK